MGPCIRTGEVMVSFSFPRLSYFPMQHQPGLLKICRVCSTGSTGREVCIGLVVGGGGGGDCGVGKNLELGSEAVNGEGSHHERLDVSEVQGQLHPKGGERAGR